MTGLNGLGKHQVPDNENFDVGVCGHIQAGVKRWIQFPYEPFRGSLKTLNRP